MLMWYSVPKIFICRELNQVIHDYLKHHHEKKKTPFLLCGAWRNQLVKLENFTPKFSGFIIFPSYPSEIEDTVNSSGKPFSTF